MIKENFEKLLEEYTSPEQIESAIRDKEAGELKGDTTKTHNLKDFPKTPQDILDLHEKTLNQATALARSFIETAKHQNLRSIQIVTGKGTGALLKAIERQLSDLKRSNIIFDFKFERKTGGSYLVYLR